MNTVTVERPGEYRVVGVGGTVERPDNCRVVGVGGRDSGRPGDYIMEGVDKLYAGRGHNACHWPGSIITLYYTVYRL